MSAIIVLAGGAFDEREVSLRSGKAVADALQASGHHVTLIDPAEGLEPHKAQLQQADAVFPALHGKGGEEGIIQAELEALGVTYVGSDSTVSALCFDKWRYRQLLKKHDILMAKGELVDEHTFTQSPLFKQPFVLKPFDSGSSIDTFVVRSPGQADMPAIAQTFMHHPRMLLEALIPGVEVTVGVLGDQALPVIEVIPPADGEFDYDNKYNGKTQELCPPQHVSEALQQQAQQLALRIHTLCGCRDLSRTDFIITPDNHIYTLETNTLPGMTDQSLYPKAAKQTGIDMKELVDNLVQMAINRKQINK
ncbi:MAG TPA: D-alanine--D-alanine ligase [Nevskiaceae bacterium]|nr:D-alanine--D-alanine ligase [Nevskiaceae bacterium]